LRAKSWLTNVSRDPGLAYANTLSMSDARIRQNLIAAHRRGAVGMSAADEVIADAYNACQNPDPLTAMSATDIAVTLPDDYLVKVDRASMAHGLEVRPPLLDHELLELAMTIPSRLKVRDGGGKWILKQAFAQELPDTVLRRPKRGFEIPVDAWLRGPLRERFQASVLDADAPVAGLIDQDAARRLYQSHLKGWTQHGNVLWLLFALATWADRYLSNSPSWATVPGGDLRVKRPARAASR
jgi:asparagine synthase (glutamine-hydrolysing)